MKTILNDSHTDSMVSFTLTDHKMSDSIKMKVHFRIIRAKQDGIMNKDSSSITLYLDREQLVKAIGAMK